MGGRERKRERGKEENREGEGEKVKFKVYKDGSMHVQRHHGYQLGSYM